MTLYVYTTVNKKEKQKKKNWKDYNIFYKFGSVIDIFHKSLI